MKKYLLLSFLAFFSTTSIAEEIILQPGSNGNTEKGGTGRRTILVAPLADLSNDLLQIITEPNVHLISVEILDYTNNIVYVQSLTSENGTFMFRLTNLLQNENYVLRLTYPDGNTFYGIINY